MFVFSRSTHDFITAYMLLVMLMQRTLNYLCLFISINEASGFGESLLQRCDQPDSICCDLLSMLSAAGQMQLLGSLRCCYCSTSSIMLRSTLKEHICRTIFSPLIFFFFFCALIFLLLSTVNWKTVISTSPMLLLWPR